MKKTNTKKKEKFLEYFKQLPVQKLAANYIGVDEDTISLWKKADSEFSDQIDQAKADWAMRKSKGVKSNEWLLERIMKDHFAEKKPGEKDDPFHMQIEFIDAPIKSDE
jgi:hypothetical protein